MNDETDLPKFGVLGVLDELQQDCLCGGEECPALPQAGQGKQAVRLAAGGWGPQAQPKGTLS